MKTDITSGAYIFHDRQLLLIHHSKLDLWLPPGGHVEPNEIPDDTAVRETLEETGLKIKLVDVLPSSISRVPNLIRQTAVPFYTNVHSVGDHNHYGLCYLAISDSKDVKTNSESRGYRWLSREEIISDKAIRQDIRDISLLAFHHYNQTLLKL